MISRIIRKSYIDFAASTRLVMLDDFEYQYALRSEVRKMIREQLPLVSEDSLVSDINSTAQLLRTSVVQAKYSEETGAHKLIVRPDMLKNDGSTTELSFLTPEEYQAKLDGKVSEEIKSAVGCKSKVNQTN